MQGCSSRAWCLAGCGHLPAAHVQTKQPFTPAAAATQAGHSGLQDASSPFSCPLPHALLQFIATIAGTSRTWRRMSASRRSSTRARSVRTALSALLHLNKAAAVVCKLAAVALPVVRCQTGLDPCRGGAHVAMPRRAYLLHAHSCFGPAHPLCCLLPSSPTQLSGPACLQTSPRRPTCHRWKPTRRATQARVLQVFAHLSVCKLVLLVLHLAAAMLLIEGYAAARHARRPGLGGEQAACFQHDCRPPHAPPGAGQPRHGGGGGSGGCSSSRGGPSHGQWHIG